MLKLTHTRATGPACCSVTSSALLDTCSTVKQRESSTSQRHRRDRSRDRPLCSTRSSRSGFCAQTAAAAAAAGKARRQRLEQEELAAAARVTAPGGVRGRRRSRGVEVGVEELGTVETARETSRPRAARVIAGAT